MILKLKTAPTSEPLDILDCAQHLRIDSTNEDAYLTSLIKAARQYVENLCGPLITQTWYQYQDRFPNGYDLAIGKPRLITVTSLKYTNEAGTQSTFSSSYYTVSIQDEYRPLIVLRDDYDWPDNGELYNTNPIEIEFTCGYGATAAYVPEPIKIAMLMLISQWYENREPSISGPGSIIAAVPFSVDALLSDYRVWF
jgi:uncharacterized phiE125 gp8 family phage protein